MAGASPDGDHGVYGITVAADLVGMGVQNLRLYEARGLISPSAPTAAPAATARTTWSGFAGSGTCSTPASTWPGSAWCCPGGRERSTTEEQQAHSWPELRTPAAAPASRNRICARWRIGAWPAANDWASLPPRRRARTGRRHRTPLGRG